MPDSPPPRVPGSPALCVMLAYDHPLFLDGLKNLLTARAVQVVGTAHDGLEALEKARSLRPEVILMDIQMPRCDGLAACRLIKAELPEIEIVMLTTSAEDADLFEALKSGASGYLLKNLKADELFDYLQGPERGEAPLSRELSAHLLREFAHQAEVIEENSWQHSAPVANRIQDASEATRAREAADMSAPDISAPAGCALRPECTP